jgi:hypothetical protein
VTSVRARLALSFLVGVPALVVVAVEVRRHGHPESFVSWPVVGVCVLAVAVAVLGVWTRPPESVAVGLVALVPAAVLIYIVPTVSPLGITVLLLLVLGAWAVRAGGFASALATFAALLLLALTVVQDPVVECHANGVSTSSGPWWVETAAGSSSGSGGGDSGWSGTTQVGDHGYAFRCRDGRLVSFGRP